LINKNTIEQKKFLEELQKQEFQKITESTLEIVRILERSGPAFREFIDKQKELNEAVGRSKEFAEVINSIFDRVKRFEESINELGNRIDNADYMGSDLLKKINRELTDLDQKFAVLKHHSQQTTDDIQGFFEDELEEIKLLTAGIRQTIQRAFEFTIDNESPLDYIRELKGIREKVNEIQLHIQNDGELKKISGDMKELIEITKNSKGEDKNRIDQAKTSGTMLDRPDGEKDNVKTIPEIKALDQTPFGPRQEQRTSNEPLPPSPPRGRIASWFKGLFK